MSIRLYILKYSLWVNMFASAFTYMYIIYIYMFTIHLLFLWFRNKVWTVYSSQKWYVNIFHFGWKVSQETDWSTQVFCSFMVVGWQKEYEDMDVSENSGLSPQIIHFNRVFHYFNHPFWGTPIFGNTHIGPSIETLHLLCMEKLKAEMVAMTEHVFHRWCSQFEAPIRHRETSDDMDQQINLRYSPMWIYQPFKRFFVLNTHIMFKGFLQNSQLNWYPLVQIYILNIIITAPVHWTWLQQKMSSRSWKRVDVRRYIVTFDGNRDKIETGWWQLNDFSCSSRLLGKWFPIWRLHIFFPLVDTAN